MLYDHWHFCLCGNRWRCRFQILPYDGGRVWCKEWQAVESACDRCLENILQAQGADMLLSFLQVAADPNTQARARKLLDAAST